MDNKPRVCYYYLKGRCHFGDNCWYDHPPKEEKGRGPEPSASVSTPPLVDAPDAATQHRPVAEYSLFDSPAIWTGHASVVATYQAEPLPAPVPQRLGAHEGLLNMSAPIVEEYDLAPTPPFTPPEQAERLPTPPPGFAGRLTEHDRHQLLGILKARVSTLVWSHQVYQAADEVSSFLTVWRLCPRPQVETICLAALIETPQNFLQAVLRLA